MPVDASVSIVGAKEAIRALGKLDKEARKQLTRDIKQIAAPIIDEAVAAYPEELLSGMARSWRTKKGRQLFPYDRGKAVKGLKVKIDTNRRSDSVVKIVQDNPAASIYETAGKGQQSSMALNLTRKFTHAMRLLWPIADRSADAVQAQMEQSVLEACRRVQKEI